mgnify:CR=1 FL=1
MPYGTSEVTISAEIDLVQARLFDSAALWSRAELVDWYNDGYKDILAKSGGVRRLWIEDVPGRVTFAYTHEWEPSSRLGRAWKFTVAIEAATRQGTSLWEAEFIEGVIPSNSLDGISQPWERCYSDETDAPFRFVLPREHDKSARVAWDGRHLTPVAVKQLDTLQSWEREPGRPIVWTSGTGRNRSFELYELRTDYQQGYAASAFGGSVRGLSGDRTYATTMAQSVANAWAYTASGDSAALSGPSARWRPTSAVTSDADLVNALGDQPYRFTLKASTDSQDAPGLGAVFCATQPWEIGDRASGRVLGTYPWEVLHGSTIISYADVRPTISGFGRRLTLAASNPSNGFATQAWEIEQLNGATVATVGTLRGAFWWEALHGTTFSFPPLGAVRSVSSPDRQYMPIVDGMALALYGSAREWHSSALAVTVTEIFVAPLELTEDDSAALIPTQMLKYLRYYVLGFALGRQGEGYRPDVATHYLSRYELGMRAMMRSHDVARKDRDYTREPVGGRSVTPPRVRFPSNFPLVPA